MEKYKEAAIIARYVSDFLCNYAPTFLTTSPCTLKSYRDALKLYMDFLEKQGINASNLSRRYLEKVWIEKWIVWLKDDRKCSQDTCNVRLGSFRAFLEYLAAQNVEFLYLYQESKQIRRQKCIKKKIKGFTRKAVSAMLSAPDLTTKTGRRDLVFIALLYATAARLDEIRSLKICQLHLHAEKPYVNLIGKGGKIRTAYLLPKIVSYIKIYLRDFHDAIPDPDAYLFYSRVGNKKEKLTEAALAKRIKICAARAHEICPDVPLDAHAHQFRHAKASHWLEDGMNVVQVSFLLGHAQLETTMRYLDISIDDKAKAIATLQSETDPCIPKKWKNPNGSLKAFCGL